jgi:alpha-L-rhamnosidase
MPDFSENTRWMVPPQSERSGAAESNEWLMFRSRMTASVSGLLRMAADSKYWLYINGESVVREGGLKRGPVPDGSYYEEVDVSAYLKAGENTVAVLLCYFGRHGFSHRDSGVPGLLVDGDGAEFSPWRVKKHPAFFDAGYIHDAFRLSESSVGFDARCDIPEWTCAAFDDSGWPEAEAAARPGEGPWGPLEKREFGQWFWSDLKAYQEMDIRPGEVVDGFCYYHCRLPYNMHFVPALSVEAKAGVRIEITVGQDTNRLSPVYITNEGAQSFEFPGWMSGEEVIYKVPSDAVQVKGFYYRETAYPSEFAGSFACDHPAFNILWIKARRTLPVNMRDNFMDCPCRERAQWPGDLIIQLGQVPYCLDREADLLVKKGLRETLRWQRGDGILYGPVPEGNWRMELPAQMLSVVSRYGIWTYYMNTGDFQTLEELYPFAKRYLDIWEFYESGLVKYRPDEKGAIPEQVDGVSVGTWDWIDWGERIDAEPAMNAWFVLAAEGVRKMAEALGRDEDARELGRRERQVRDAFSKTFWNEVRGGFVSDDFEFEPDDRVQALAVLCGAASPEQAPKLLQIFETVEQACPYMEKYVLEALFVLGDADAALRRMERRYRSMIDNENTTLWERWPDWSEHPGTINHAWSGGPLTLLSEKTAGIFPLEPGWSRTAVCPAPGGLSLVKASVDAPQGRLCLTAEKAEDEWRVEIEVPDGMTAVADLSALGSADVPEEFGAGVHEMNVCAAETEGTVYA